MVDLRSWAPHDTIFLFGLGADDPALERTTKDKDETHPPLGPSPWFGLFDAVEALEDWHSERKSPDMESFVKTCRYLVNEMALESDRGAPNNDRSKHLSMAVYTVGEGLVTRFALRRAREVEESIAQQLHTQDSTPNVRSMGGKKIYSWSIDGLEFHLGFGPGHGVLALGNGIRSARLMSHLAQENVKDVRRVNLEQTFTKHGISTRDSGFIDWLALVKLLKSLSLRNDSSDPSTKVDICLGELSSLAALSPRITFGRKDRHVDGWASRWVFTLDKSLGRLISRLEAGQAMIGSKQRTGFHLRVNLNLGGLLEEMRARRRRLAQRPFLCPQLQFLNPNQSAHVTSVSTASRLLETIEGLALSVGPGLGNPKWGQIRLQTSGAGVLQKTLTALQSPNGPTDFGQEQPLKDSIFGLFFPQGSEPRLRRLEDELVIEFGNIPAHVGLQPAQGNRPDILLLDHDFDDFAQGAVKLTRSVRTALGSPATVGTQLEQFVQRWRGLRRVRTTLRLNAGALVMDHQMSIIQATETTQ